MKTKLKNQSAPFKEQQEQQAFLAQHAGMVKFYTEKFLGKLCLVGIEGQGIERSFLTDIKGEMPGMIALRLAASNDSTAGMYFDVRQVRFYHIFDEVATAKFVEEFEKKHLTTGQPVPISIVDKN